MFSRQTLIEDWQQNLIASQTCLCIGIGAIGCNVIVQLLRLGVSKVILIDNGYVDITNMNRQTLYQSSDISSKKTEAALNNLSFHNINNTQIEAHHLDAVTQFHVIQEYAKKSDVIFNMIDYGDSYDYLIQSLCLSLNKPFIQGGTFSHSLTIDVIAPSDPLCLLCMNPSDSLYIQQIVPQLTSSIQDASFLPQNDNPISQSNVFLASQASSIMIAMYVHKILFKDPLSIPINRVLFYVNDLEILKYSMERDSNCIFCKEKKGKDEENDKLIIQ